VHTADRIREALYKSKTIFPRRFSAGVC
jgi:hypothetical protein